MPRDAGAVLSARFDLLCPAAPVLCCRPVLTCCVPRRRPVAADEEPTDVLRGAHTQSAPQMFPSCLCTAATSIIALLDDTAVTPDGVAVYCVAQRVSTARPAAAISEHDWRT